jgi:hypothetical protein
MENSGVLYAHMLCDIVTYKEAFFALLFPPSAGFSCAIIAQLQ